MCRHQDTIAVENARPAVRLIGALLEAGVPVASLAIASAEPAPPLPGEVQALNIPFRPAKPRCGRANHQLFLAPPGVCAKSAAGATVSMRGLHWIALLVGSALLARGDI